MRVLKRLFNRCAPLVFMSTVCFSTPVLAQVSITGLNAAYDNVTDTSLDYSVIGVGTGTFPIATTFNMRFNISATNNLSLTSMTTAGGTFVREDLSDICFINRVDNAVVTGIRELVFYERDSFVSPDLDLRSTGVAAVGAMDAVLLNSIINRGTDNVFQNQGNGDGNNNNIERIDFVFTGGLSVPPVAIANVGFLVLERGGNDAFQIAAVTAIDGSGIPTAYGTILSVSTAFWGASAFNLNTSVFRKDPADSDLRPAVNVFAQNVSGVYVSFADLGIVGNQTIYGYSLFPPDVGADLIGLSDAVTTTGSTGSMDLIAGGSVYRLNSVMLEGDLLGEKTDAVLVDNDSDGLADPGDTLRYTVVVSNPGDGLNATAHNVVFTSGVDANTSLVVGSVTTSQGTVNLGNTGGDTTVEVDIGDIPDGDIGSMHDGFF